MTEREAQRLAKISEKMEQMKAQKQNILTREKKRQRKERTHRLIQIGALSEKYFGLTDIEPVNYEVFLKTFAASQNAMAFVAQIKAGLNNEQRANTESTTSEHSAVPNE